MILWFALWSSAWAVDPPPSDPPPSDPPPTADADLARARELFANGAKLYDDGLYAEAITAFKAAYVLSKRPALLFNIANSYERLGDLQATVDALNTYRAFATAAEAESVDRRLTTLERRLAQQNAEKAATVPVVVVAQPQPVPVTTLEKRPRSVPIAVIGAALVAAGGATAAITFAQSRGFRDAGDEAGWNSVRPMNTASPFIAGVGAGVFLLGILPVSTRAADVRIGLAIRPDATGIGATGQF